MGNDKTKWIFDDNDAEGEIDADYTESLTPPPSQTVADTPTRALDTTERTELFVRGHSPSDENATKLPDQVDPVVGWLVVVKGPGLGHSIALGPGVNTIGRGANERAALPFGDKLISSEDHAKILYDDQERVFYVAHGSGRNITRVDGAIVANPVVLENYALIQLTNATHLRFVAFCNKEFDWGDLYEGDDAQT